MFTFEEYPRSQLDHIILQFLSRSVRNVYLIESMRDIPIYPNSHQRYKQCLSLLADYFYNYLENKLLCTRVLIKGFLKIVRIQ